MSKSRKKDEIVEDFKAACRSEFGYLLRDFGFREDDTPPGEFENEFRVRFVRQDFAVVVEGVHHGSAAMAYLEDPRGRKVPPRLLDPGFRPLQEELSKQTGEGQIAEIKIEAKLLYEHGLDLLRGDFSVFESAVEKWKSAWAEYEGRRAFGIAEQEAVAAFKNREWSKVIEALKPYEAKISPRMAKKLNAAREHILAGRSDEPET